MTSTSTPDARNSTGAAAHDDRPLAGCVALVTGASSGIGAATARALAAQGASLALVARRAERLDTLAGEVETGAAGGPLTLAADLADPDRAGQVADEAAGHFGRLDVVVNCAGFAARSSVEESDPADWDRMLDLNVRALLRTSHAALPHLLRAAEGPRGVADLVNLSSVAGRLSRKGNSVYAATKHAVGAFSDSLRQEVAGRGVRVGLVEPGMVTTEMTAEGTSIAAFQSTPRDRWLAAEDIARSVAFMVTQPAHAAVNEVMVRPTVQEA